MPDSRAATRAGRLVSALMLVQLAGLIVPFVLLLPVASPGSMEGAARVAWQVRTAILLLFANGAVTLGIAITLFPRFRDAGPGWALWLVAASVVWFVMQSVDNALIMTMLSWSEAHGGGAPLAASGLADLTGSLLHTARTWAHYTTLLVIDAWFVLFYGLLYRRSLVPRALSGLGLAMAAVHAGAVTLPRFLDYEAVPLLGASLAVSHLAVAGWLGVHGLDQSNQPHLPIDQRRAE